MKNTKNMVFNKYNFLIKNFTAKESSRPEISGIFLTPKKSVATDSFVLIEVDTPKIDKSDIPEINPKPNLTFNSFILPNESCQKIEKLFNGEKKDILPFTQYAFITKDSNDFIQIGKLDPNTMIVDEIKSHKIQGEYPQYQELLQEKGKYLSIKLNPEYLRKVADFFTKFVNHTKGIEIRIPFDKESPVRILGKKESQNAVVLIMPIKSDN